MVTVKYQRRTLRVVAISHTNNPFRDRDNRYFGVVTDPEFVDGMRLRNPDPSTGPGSPDEPGFIKIVERGRNRVRNATQEEIDAFEPDEDADEADFEVERVRDRTHLPRGAVNLVGISTTYRNENLTVKSLGRPRFEEGDILELRASNHTHIGTGTERTLVLWIMMKHIDPDVYANLTSIAPGEVEGEPALYKRRYCIPIKRLARFASFSLELARDTNIGYQPFLTLDERGRITSAAPPISIHGLVWDKQFDRFI